jgi:hypothetical protein
LLGGDHPAGRGKQALQQRELLRAEFEAPSGAECDPAAMTVLTYAGATVVAIGWDTLAVSGLPAERIVALLSAAAVPFSEVSAHRATLEEAYLELTRDAVEYRAEPAREAAK